MIQSINKKTVITFVITVFCAVVIPMMLIFTLPKHTIEECGIGYLFYKSMVFGVYLIVLTLMVIFYNPKNVYKKITHIFSSFRKVPFLVIKIAFYLIVFISFYLSVTSILDIYMLY